MLSNPNCLNVGCARSLCKCYAWPYTWLQSQVWCYIYPLSSKHSVDRGRPPQAGGLVYTMSSKSDRVPSQQTKSKTSTPRYWYLGIPGTNSLWVSENDQNCRVACMHPLNSYVCERQWEEYFPEWTDFSHTIFLLRTLSGEWDESGYKSKLLLGMQNFLKWTKKRKKLFFQSSQSEFLKSKIEVWSPHLLFSFIKSTLDPPSNNSATSILQNRGWFSKVIFFLFLKPFLKST